MPILSLSGAHDIPAGGLLPDSLTAFLTASPFSYTASAAPPLFAQGQHIGDSAVAREAYNFYAQDQWQVSSRLTITAGLRYEVNSRIKERDQRTSSLVFENSSGASVDAMTPGAQAVLLINNQPAYRLDLNGFGPRLAIDWHLPANLVFHAGGAITTMLPNLWQDNFATGYLPYVVTPLETAAPGAPLTFSNTVQTLALPAVYTPSGQLIYASGNSKAVPPNTPMDVLALLSRIWPHWSPSHPTGPGNRAGDRPDLSAMDTLARTPPGSTGNSATYPRARLTSAPWASRCRGWISRMATPALRPVSRRTPSSIRPGRSLAATARFTNSQTARTPPTTHCRSRRRKTSLRAGLGLQVGYTFSKSIDDTSSVLGGFLTGSSGTLLQAVPQNPRDLGAEKGPSTFDVPQYFSASVIQQLPVSRLPGFRALPRRLSSGWQLSWATGSISSGSPFTVYSGIQQTGAGVLGADRPDEIAQPVLSTSRTIREDYFGLGANNASFFYIPIDVPGGTGPNHGMFGTLGRNTFRGPGMHDVDLSLLKDTPLGTSRNPERAILQFRAEFFNVFNIVNFGLPSNTVLGPGFGEISRTSTPSRQIQLSLKVLF